MLDYERGGICLQRKPIYKYKKNKNKRTDKYTYFYIYVFFEYILYPEF